MITDISRHMYIKKHNFERQKWGKPDLILKDFIKKNSIVTFENKTTYNTI